MKRTSIKKGKRKAVLGGEMAHYQRGYRVWGKKKILRKKRGGKTLFRVRRQAKGPKTPKEF